MYNIDYKEFRNYKELRLKKGLSQAKAAKTVGVSLGAWLTWEYGVGNPNFENYNNIKKLEALPDKE